MRIGVKGAVLGVLVLVAGPAAADPSPVDGDWFTEGTEHGAFVQLIYHRVPDGTFFVRIRQLDHCEPVDRWVESGTWTYVDNAIEQVTANVKGRKVDFKDTYKIVSEIGTSFKTYDPKTGITWELLKVPADFQFPSRQECATS